MQLKTYFAQDASGNIIPNAQVFVYLAGTTTLASGIVDQDGAPLTNPFNADSSAAVVFAAPDGEYDVKCSGASRTVTIRAQLFDGGAFKVDLAASGGSALVGYDSGTAQDVLDEAKPMANYTALSNYTGRATGVRITQAGLAGFFQRDDADTTSADNGGTIIVDASGRRWKRLLSGCAYASWFNPAGDDSADDTAKLVNLFACGAREFDLGDGKTYKVALSEGQWIGKFTGGSVSIRGENVLIHDVSTGYTFDGAFTPLFWGVGTNGFSCVGVNYEGPLLSDLNTQLGYIGATFVRVTDGARNTHVVANITNARHGIQSGDYNLWDRGYCDGFTGTITGERIGYPLALYLASNINVDVDCDQFHRLAYLAGCKHIRGTVRGKDQYVAPIFVLITDAKTSASTSRGCLDYRMRVFDKGSTVYPSGARLVGLVPSWSFDGTEYEDIDMHAHIVSTDSIASKLAHAAVYTQGGGVDWKTTHKIKNLKISGVLDRSAQTTTEQDTSGEIYISALSGVYADGKFAQVEGFDLSGFVYKPGTGSKPRGFQFFMPALVGGATVQSVNFGDAPVIWATNATTLTTISNSRLRGSYNSTSDSPYNSAILFENCAITDSAYQPSVNKRYLNTLTNGGGATTERLVTELTLSGASATWANSLPNQCVILGVSGRVTQDITGATGFTVGTAAATSRFFNTNTLTAGTTFGPANGTDTSPQFQVGTGSIVVTAKTSNFTGGKIRLMVDYIRLTPPQS